MKVFEIDQQLANEILNYLASKPFIEVHKYIGGLQNLKEIKPTKCDIEKNK